MTNTNDGIGWREAIKDHCKDRNEALGIISDAEDEIQRQRREAYELGLDSLLGFLQGADCIPRDKEPEAHKIYKNLKKEKI